MVRICPETGKLIAAAVLPPGTLLEGKYEIGRALGVGSVGAVFEAAHTTLHKKVVVRAVLPEQYGGDEEITSGLVQDALAASALNHRHIGRVIDVGWVDKGTMFMVMEHLNGTLLADLLSAETRLPLGRSLRLLNQVLLGLERAHKEGLVHRDLKPSNLMVLPGEDEQDEVKLLDFGLFPAAQKVGAGEDVQVHFQSPEQLHRGSPSDHRTDIYSAGALLYAMIRGRPPFTGDSVSNLTAAIQEGSMDLPSMHNAALPPALDLVLLKAMALDPEDRFSDVLTFRQALSPLEEETREAPTEESLEADLSSLDGLLSGDLMEGSLVALDERKEEDRADLADAGQPEPPSGGKMQITLSSPEEPPLQIEGNSPSPPSASTETDGPGKGGDSSIGLEADLDNLDVGEFDQRFNYQDDDIELDLDAVKAQSVPRPKPRVTGPHQPAKRRMGRVTGPHQPSDKQTGQTTGHQPAGARSRRWLWLAPLLAVMVGGGGWLFFNNSPELSPGQAASPALAPPEKPMVKISVTTEPKDAKVMVDNMEIRKQPMMLFLSTSSYTLSVSAKGYVTKKISFQPEKDLDFEVTLEKEAAAPKPEKRKKRKKRKRRGRRK